MWQAVISQAFIDSTNRRLPQRDRIEALRWLCNGGLDFEIVCDMANVSSDAVRKKNVGEKNT
jgi:hypothetical protein